MPYQTIAPAEFDLYTGGKQPEIAITFNQAFTNIDRYINNLMNWPPGTEALTRMNEYTDKVFVFLRQYLWKGNAENKNSSGYALDPTDKSIIIQILKKLPELRNFQSHFWHTNAPISFTDELRNFIQNKHDWACGQLLEIKSLDADLYFKQQDRYPLFKENKFITQEGRIFFLSFFLHKGQMQSLLQRRKGSKRHDLPEYKFKHKLFTYYCHREGSAWLATGIDNSILPTMDEDIRNRIYHGRQANRILSYLKDKPLYETKDSQPLVMKDGKFVEDMTMLIAYIEETNIIPGFQFYEKDVQPSQALPEGKEYHEGKKQNEKMTREQFRRFILPDRHEYEFEISYSVLRRIVTEILLDSHTSTTEENGLSSLEHFKGVLLDCIETRLYIYQNLKDAGDAPIHPENYALKKRYSSIYINYEEYEGSIQEQYYTGDQWRTIPISPTLGIEKLLIQWHNSFTMGAKSEPLNRGKLLNAIRPNTEDYQALKQTSPRRNSKWSPSPKVLHKDPEPLLFHLAYFFREKKVNIRAEDNFLEWGVRYLMDMNLVPDWYFETEQLVYKQKINQPETPYKLKKEIRWEKIIPDNYRLAITDNQLNIGVWLNERSYRLRIGERLLKYLLYWHFSELNKQGKSINEFLLALSGDLVLLHESSDPVAISQLTLLEAFAIPALYFKTIVQVVAGKEKTSSTYKDQARQYLLDKIQWIDTQVASLTKLSRSQKNGVLMDTYRLFDFAATEGSKFLRKNEYEQMSVCHFMLNQDKSSVRHLVERTFRLKKRLPHEILQLLYGVADQERGNLDELCIKVLRNRKTFLQNKINLLSNPGLKTKQVRKEVTGSLAIYFDDGNLTEEELSKRKQARVDSLEHLPFAVHPAMALKYFYPGPFAEKGFCKEGEDYTNLFLKLRNDRRLTAPLPAENYPEDAYRKIGEGYMARFPDNPAFGRFLKKRIGQLNTIKVKDILLLQIAERYLEKYDAHSIQDFRLIRSLKQLDLKQLFSQPAVIPITIDQNALLDVDPIRRASLPRSIFLELYPHQLDDHFYRSQKANLFRLAVFYLNWRKEELERYQDYPEIQEKLTLWPEGTKDNPLRVSSLIEALRTNSDHAGQLMEYIFNYEAWILNGHLYPQDKSQKQATLLQYSQQYEKGIYISFPTILSWDVETLESIKREIIDLRISCLHNLIPVNGSFRHRTWPGSALAEALKIDVPLGKDRSEFNIYEQYEAREV